MRSSVGWWVAMCLGGLLVAWPAQSDDARAGIDAVNAELAAAFASSDAAAVSKLYTEDAQVIGPGSPVASGRAAIATFWQGAMDSGIAGVALETLDVDAQGTLATETGRVQLTAKDGALSSARYVVVWKKVGDRWYLHRDIWNSGAPGE